MITKKTYWRLVEKKSPTLLEEKQMEVYTRWYKSKNIRLIQRQFVRSVLPNARVGSAFAMGNPYNIHTFARLEGIGGQRALKGSDYDYPLTKQTRLVHYTGHDRLVDILREGAFRAFSLSHSSDGNEFIAKATELGCADWNLSKWRDNLFSMSFVDLSRHGESERHWKEYGRNGRGVGIVVSIEHKYRYKWADHYFGPIFYDGENETRFARIKAEIEAFEKEHVFRWDRPEDYYAKLFAFHKLSGFTWEDEVRLLIHWEHRTGSGSDGEYGKRKDLWKHMNSRYKRSYSIPLYLGTKLDSHLARPNDPQLETMIKHIGPRLKIEEVIVGPEVSSREFMELFECCNELARETIGNTIPMRWSDQRRNERTGTRG